METSPNEMTPFQMLRIPPPEGKSNVGGRAVLLRLLPFSRMMVLMGSSETEALAAELYLVPPARFVAARDALVRQAREAGHRELAGELSGLRRPTVSAWLVNLLTRHERARMESLVALGTSPESVTDRSSSSSMHRGLCNE